MHLHHTTRHSQIAKREILYTVLLDGVFAHLTLAESLNNLFSTLS